MSRCTSVFPPEKQPIAVYSISNWGGVELLGVNCDVDDKVEIATNNGNKRKYRGFYKTYTTARDRMYFVMGGVRYYLDEFVRV